MYGGRVHFSTPMLWFLGFIFIFTTGGMTGVLMAVPPADFQVHNSLFLIAHFHSMVIGGVLFGFFAAYSYWFPKLMGFKLNEQLGRYAFWCWFIGFLLAFMPLYFLGMMGATRRLNHYEAATGWHPLFLVAAVGIVLILIGMVLQNVQLIVSIIERNKLRDRSGDPWHGRTLEWSTSSPPPFYNYAVIPQVDERDPFWALKKKGEPRQQETISYQDIHSPKNTGMGLYIAAGSFFFGFGVIWHIWWLAALGMLGVIIFTILRLSTDETEEIVPAAKIARLETRKEAIKQGLL
jgi:cytochrome o ubiquinol oxidase subunit 1